MEPALDDSRGALARTLRTVATLRALVEEKDGMLAMVSSAYHEILRGMLGIPSRLALRTFAPTPLLPLLSPRPTC